MPIPTAAIASAKYELDRRPFPNPMRDPGWLLFNVTRKVLWQSWGNGRKSEGVESKAHLTHPNPLPLPLLSPALSSLGPGKTPCG